MGSGPQHQALLPVAEMPKAWETLVAATYANLRNVPVLWSRTNSVDKGKWIAPGQAVVVEEEEDGGGGGGEEKVEYAKRLSKVRRTMHTVDDLFEWFRARRIVLLMSNAFEQSVRWDACSHRYVASLSPTLDYNILSVFCYRTRPVLE